MVIVWKGKGWQVAVVTFLSSLVAEILTRFITNDNNYFSEQPLPIALAFLCSSTILYFIVQRMKGTNELTNELLDFEEKSKINYKKTDHSLFFIPMEYWIIIDAVISLYIFCERTGYI